MSIIAPKAFLHGLLSCVAPSTCLGCSRHLPPDSNGDVGVLPLATLCTRCLREIRWLAEETCCEACAQALGAGAQRTRRCASCKSTPLGGVSSTTALVRYRGPARRLLHRIKYAKREGLARPLGEELGRSLQMRRPTIAEDKALRVVPVPLHYWRHWRRGFNQAEAMGEGVATVLERPLLHALRRRRATPALFGVARAERESLVCGAFVARQELDGERVLLVDDIRTSGATLRAAARALLEAGASRVDAAVVAR